MYRWPYRLPVRKDSSGELCLVRRCRIPCRGRAMCARREVRRVKVDAGVHCDKSWNWASPEVVIHNQALIQTFMVGLGAEESVGGIRTRNASIFSLRGLFQGPERSFRSTRCRAGFALTGMGVERRYSYTRSVDVGVVAA